MVNDFYWTATDLKEFSVCPRLTWFKRRQGLREPDTSMMAEGVIENKATTEKERRRRYQGKSLATKKKVRNVYVASEELGFHGIIDSVILDDSGDIIVEDKYSKSSKKTINSGFIQAGLYAMLWEDYYPDRKVSQFWVKIGNRTEEYDWDENNKAKIKNLLEEFSRIIDKGNELPEITYNSSCQICWYSRICWGRL